MTIRRTLVSTLAAAALSLGALTASPAHAADPGPTSDSRTVLSARFFASSAARRAPDHAIVDSIRADLPADWLARVDATRQRLGLRPAAGEQALGRRIARSIDPGRYQCAPTPYDAYVDSIYAAIDPRTLNALYLLGALDLPAIDAQLHGTQADPRYAVLAPYRGKVLRTFTQEQTFWAIPLTGVQLVGMHGELLTDPARVSSLLVELGIARARARRIAVSLAELVQSDPALDGGANPVLTLGAFATTGTEGGNGVRKVVLGDGLLRSTTALGLGGVGGQTVVSHEMGHQLQISAGIPVFVRSFTAIRRVELEADGFAGYFLAHPRGGALAPSALAGVALMAYNAGDCEVGVPGSHGTPNQRRASVQWGVAEVAYASDPAAVAAALVLDTDFTKALKVILRPDAVPTPDDFRAVLAS